LTQGASEAKKPFMREWFLTLVLVILTPMVFAELPPSAYEAMQAQAPECLQINVLKVEIEPGTLEDQQNIHLTANVLNIARSAEGLKKGAIIHILYTVTDHQPPWVGPGQVPILKEGATNVAYLKKGEKTDVFQPAAGIMSFRHF